MGNRIIDDIETHPIVTAIVLFTVALVGTTLFSKKSTTGTTAGDVNPGAGFRLNPVTGAYEPIPNVQETYNQTYNSYPIVPGATPLTPVPIPTPTPTPTPTPEPTCKPGVDYGLIPFNDYKGPSYSNLPKGTKYTHNGITYTLFTGGGGRLYGNSAANGNQLLRQPESFYPGGINYKCK